jgi:predicted dehydrogenase/threonine dehydrogenase-like Zn-dependent dehydrogenase
MKQILITDQGRKVLDVAVPTPGNNEILVAVHASVISTGTETMGSKKDETSFIYKLQEKKELWDKVNKYTSENGLKATITAIRSKLSVKEQSQLFRPVGYSNAGQVVAKGQMVTGFNVGDRVACAGAGIASHAEFTTVPVNMAVKIPKEVSFESAGFTTIGAIAMQGIRRADVTFGETVVITGLGLLGLIAVQIAKAWGLTVIGTDLNPSRLDLAKEVGADYCFNPMEPDFIKNVENITQGNGPDAVIIYAATSSSEPANQALKICRRKGRVVVVGAIGMELQREDMYSKELDFVMSTSYGPGRYDKQYELKGIDYPIGYVRWTENRNMMEFVKLLANGRVNVGRLISNSFTIDQVSEAYRSLTENPGENIAAVFKYSHEENEILATRIETHPRVFNSDKIGAGIIGAGGFVQRNHLANMLNMPESYDVKGIAQKTPASAKTVGEKYRVKYVTTDYQEILRDPDIDLVVIGTRHNLHASQVLDSIKYGKHVLVEKPLAMNHNEMSMIEEAIKKNPNLTVAVGFNRRYSSLTQIAKRLVQKNGTPTVINYRVNAGFVPLTSWVQDLEEGGGRIIGEVCHFVDLIAYLASDEVKSINVVHVPIDGLTIKAEDNLIISMAFQKGSIGVLTYTSVGGRDMEKERIEVFTNGSSLVISDFIELQVYNCNEKSFKLKEVDKGHKGLIRELAKKLQGKESLILPFENDIAVTNLTLAIVDQIHSLNSLSN